MFETRWHDIPQYEDGALVAVAEEHLDGVSQALLLVERRLLAVEVVELHTMELGGVAERLLRAGGVFHEQQVHRHVLVQDLEVLQVAPGLQRLLELPAEEGGGLCARASVFVFLCALHLSSMHIKI